MQVEDWPQVRTIYQEGIDTGQATFETAVPSWSAWDAGKHTTCRFVVRMNGVLAGWCALSPVSTREVYAGIAEASIYIAAVFRGEGIGKTLLQAMVTCADENGFWTLQAVMFPENQASVALHQACGFRMVGRRQKIARHHGAWRDTVLLERRSQAVT